jgi:hypothetical protein
MTYCNHGKVFVTTKTSFLKLTTNNNPPLIVGLLHEVIIRYRESWK